MANNDTDDRSAAPDGEHLEDRIARWRAADPKDEECSCIDLICDAEDELREMRARIACPDCHGTGRVECGSFRFEDDGPKPLYSACSCLTATRQRIADLERQLAEARAAFDQIAVDFRHRLGIPNADWVLLGHALGDGDAGCDDGELLALLRKLADGTGGRRTGELRRRGWLSWVVTAQGQQVLARRPADDE